MPILVRLQRSSCKQTKHGHKTDIHTQHSFPLLVTILDIHSIAYLMPTRQNYGGCSRTCVTVMVVIIKLIDIVIRKQKPQICTPEKDINFYLRIYF